MGKGGRHAYQARVERDRVFQLVRHCHVDLALGQFVKKVQQIGLSATEKRRQSIDENLGHVTHRKGVHACKSMLMQAGAQRSWS